MKFARYFSFFKKDDDLKWTHVADKQECGGSEVNKRGVKDMKSCARECYGVSSMFIYGTNDFGTNRCGEAWVGNGCACVCETAAKVEGTCNMVKHNGYRLFKYEKG